MYVQSICCHEGCDEDGIERISCGQVFCVGHIAEARLVERAADAIVELHREAFVELARR